MRLLIVGTGRMAANHAEAFAAMDGVEVVAGVDVRPDVLAEFCTKHGIARQFAAVEDAVAWGEFDAATVVVPDNAHKAAVLPLLAAGKHVLCEKPLAPNHADADEMTRAAEAAGVVAMVHLTYRGVAALARAREMMLAGEVGEIRHVEASYLQSWLLHDAWGDWRTEPSWLWRLSSKHGSLGVLGDLGVHLFDFVCHGTGLAISNVHCRLQTFAKAPDERIGEYVLDANDSAVIDVEFGNGALGLLHATRWAGGHQNDLSLRIHGHKCSLDVRNTMQGNTLALCQGDDIKAIRWRPVDDLPAVPTVYERFAAAVAGTGPADPGFRHAADMQRVLDLSFASSGDGNRRATGMG